MFDHSGICDQSNIKNDNNHNKNNNNNNVDIDNGCNNHYLHNMKIFQKSKKKKIHKIAVESKLTFCESIFSGCDRVTPTEVSCDVSSYIFRWKTIRRRKSVEIVSCVFVILLIYFHENYRVCCSHG